LKGPREGTPRNMSNGGGGIGTESESNGELGDNLGQARGRSKREEPKGNPYETK